MMNVEEQIAEALMEQTVLKKTSKISVKEICDSGHISRTTFYKHFKDINDVVAYIIRHDAMKNLDVYVKNNCSAQMIMENWFASFYVHRNFYRIAINENGQNSLFATVLDLIEEYNISIFRPLIEDAQELEYCAYKYSALQVMLLKKWIMDGMTISPEKLAYIHLTNYLGCKFTD